MKSSKTPFQILSFGCRRCAKSVVKLFFRRWFVYCLVICFITYLLGEIYFTRPGINIQCPCLSWKTTEERVSRYLDTLLREQNRSTNRTAGEQAELENPSLPLRFLARLEALGSRCSSVPGLFDIQHRNSLWQEAQVGATTFLIYSAFMDHRDQKEGSLIRILAMANKESPAIPTCHLYDAININKAPVASKAIRVDYLHWDYPKRGEWHPFLITCRAGETPGKLANVVSLVSNPCSAATNAIRIADYPREKRKRNLALCHKFIFNSAQDYSMRIIEWLELARAWGIDHVTLYLAAAHINVKKTLEYYERTTFVTVVPWSNPGGQPNIPSLYRILYDTQRYVLFTSENIPYTDCLLRHIGTHRYVGVWDMDEFIFPIRATTLTDMVDEAFSTWKRINKLDPSSKPPTSYLARSSYFFDNNVDVERIRENFNQILAKSEHRSDLIGPNGSVDVNKLMTYFPKLSHTIRTFKFSPPGVFTKSIHDTSRALGLHSHFALYNLEGPIRRTSDLYHLYPSGEGFLGHFRSKCQGEDQSECEQSFKPFVTRDQTLWRNSSDIIFNTLKVIKDLNLT